MNYFERGGSVTGVMPMPTVRAAPSLDDLTRFIAEGLAQPVIDGFRQAAANLNDSLAGFGRAPAVGYGRSPAHEWRGKTHRDWRKECCGEPDPCHCRCCIVDADLVVYARLGERRVIPLTVENRWRRERKIKMELSAFSSRSGGASAVTGQLLPPAPEFTLPPCRQESVVLVVNASLAGANIDNADGRQKLPDVDDCQVSYADLRVEGCELRPLRIAVALLPRDCGDYRIICDCACC
jgi:hypothetical protein